MHRNTCSKLCGKNTGSIPCFCCKFFKTCRRFCTLFRDGTRDNIFANRSSTQGGMIYTTRTYHKMNNCTLQSQYMYQRVVFVVRSCTSVPCTDTPYKFLSSRCTYIACSNKNHVKLTVQIPQILLRYDKVLGGLRIS